MAAQSIPAWVPEDSFGSRLLRLRKQLGLKQDEIAAKCGLNRVTWHTWENGSSPRNMGEVVQKIHLATGVSREWLAWGTPPSGPVTPTDVDTPYPAWFTADNPQIPARTTANVARRLKVA